VSELKTTVQVRLYPTPEQATLLRAHCQEYISAINVLTQALDYGVLPDEGKGASTKDFIAALPSAVKNQALRDARSVWKRAFELGRIPVLRKPICQWNNQNWRIESQAEGNTLLLPTYQDGQVRQIAIRCASRAQEGTPGLLRIKRKRGKWIAEIAFTLPAPEPTTEQGVMGVDLGVKIPAVIYVAGKGTRYLGNGRYQRMMRRRFYARRKQLQQAAKVRAVRKSQGKERRWMRDINHKLSRQIVTHAQAQSVGVIRLEQLAGIRQRTCQRTARTSRGAKARRNNRMIATWPFYQLSTFVAYKAERVGIKVEQVDPAYTSQTCPACFVRNKAQDRRYVCSECGWIGHRDAVGAINNSRRTALRGDSVGAAIAIRL
jgi:IS605 OrfB family transposase